MLPKHTKARAKRARASSDGKKASEMLIGTEMLETKNKGKVNDTVDFYFY